MSCWGNMRRSSWVYPTAVLSLYGFFANCRPAEPFLTPYLVGPKNISEEVVTNYLFPIWTYSYMVLLLPVFLLTDFLRYKPLIVMQGVFLIANYLLLCFAPSLEAMTYLQVNFACVTSTEVAYFSYIYSVIPAKWYQRATGYLRSAMLTGFTVGATLGQLLLSLAGTSYFLINAVTLGLMCVALLVSLALPMPQKGMFFHRVTERGEGASRDPQIGQGKAAEGEAEVREEKGSDGDSDSVQLTEASGGCSMEAVVQAFWMMRSSLLEAYGSRRLVYWSLWWALATAGYGQVFNYIQLVWDHIEPSSTSSVYNGGVEAVCTLVGAAAALSVGYMRVRFEVWGELCLGVFSTVGAVCVFLIGLTNIIWVSYAGYVIFKASYMLLITITTFQIATNLSMECYALTFGINNFVALTLQTIITSIVVDKSALGLDIISQFIVYGSFYSAISLLFLIRGAYTACAHHCSPDSSPRPDTEEPEQDITG